MVASLQPRIWPILLISGVLVACQDPRCLAEGSAPSDPSARPTIPPVHAWESAQNVHHLKPFGEVPADQICTNAILHGMAVSPDSQLLAVSMGSVSDRHCGGQTPTSLTLWDLQSGQRLHTLHDGVVDAGPTAAESAQESDITVPVGDVAHQVAFSPDGSTLAGAMSDSTIRLWDVASGQLIRTLEGHRDGVHALVMAPDNQTLISGSSDQTIRLWHWRTGQNLCVLKGPDRVYDLALDRSGRYLISSTAPTYHEYQTSTFYDQHQTQLWDLHTGQTLQTWPAYPAVFSPDGQQLLGIIDSSIRRWAISTATPLPALALDDSRFRTLAISPDGQWVVSHSGTILPNNQYRGQAHLWHLQTGQRLKSLPLPAHGFSPDGTLLIAYEGEEVVLWNWEQGRQVRAFDTHFAAGWGRDRAAFSPDGQTLITVDYALPGLQVWR